MLEAFWVDKSRFKLGIILRIALGFIFLIGTVAVHNQYITVKSKNKTLHSKYLAEATWLKSFNQHDAIMVQKEMLKPARQDEVHGIINEQMEIFRQHNVKVESVSTTEFKTASKQRGAKAGNQSQILNSVKTSVSLCGSWENIRDAFNDFDKNHLVSINDMTISLLKNNRPVTNHEQQELGVRFTFNTYYF